MKKLASFLSGIILIAPLSFGQGNTGLISGTVTDQTGALLPGVTVAATHVESNASRAPYETTGEEILRESPEPITHFVGGVGTGGTLDTGER